MRMQRTAILSVLAIWLSLPFAPSIARAEADPDEQQRQYLPGRGGETDTPSPGPGTTLAPSWMEASEPAEQHRVLDALVGRWETSTHVWTSTASPSDEHKGKAEFHWILDGRFLEQNVHGGLFGRPFHALAIFGYDIPNRRYVASWFDNLTTTPHAYQGSYDSSARTFTFLGAPPDPIPGSQDRPMRQTLRIEDAKTLVQETWDVSGSPAIKVMETRYTREL